MKRPRLPARNLLPGMGEELISPSDWSRRAATLVSAVMIGLVAIGFAIAGDHASNFFERTTHHYPWVYLVSAPLVFVAIAAATNRLAPDARGSGIPQVIAASRMPGHAAIAGLVAIRTALFKPPANSRTAKFMSSVCTSLASRINKTERRAVQ